MNTTVKEKHSRVQANFRFEKDMVEDLKARAKKEKRSLNNYVEVVLLDFLYGSNEPNTETKAAINELENDYEKLKKYNSIDEIFDDL